MFTAEEVMEIGICAKWENDEAREWRRGVEHYYYQESLKKFEAEPWRVSYWTTMNESTFMELRDEPREEREFALDLIDAFVNGTLPDCWYSTFDAPRAPFGDDPDRHPFVQEMRGDWRTFGRRLVGYFMSLTEK